MIAEYDVKAGDKVYSLKYNNKALRMLEKTLDMPLIKIGEMLQNNLSINALTEIFRVGLLHSHPEITVDEAGEIMDELGLTKTAEAVGKALGLAFGEEDNKKDEELKNA